MYSMKKHILAFTLLSVLVLAGCSENSLTSSETATSSETPISSVEEPSTTSSSSEETPVESSTTDGEDSSTTDDGDTSSGDQGGDETIDDSHDYVVDFASISSTAAFGEEASSSGWTMGDFYIWNDQGWCGANITMTENGYNSTTGGYDFAWTTEDYDSGWVNVAQWYAMQFFMKLPSGALGDVGSNFTITATITVAEEMKVTICGNELTLVAGTNEITDLLSNTTVYDTAADNCELSVQAGWESDNSHTYTGDISIDYLAFDAYVIPDNAPADDDSHDYVVDLANMPASSFSSEDGLTSVPRGSIYYWNDQWWCGGYVTVGEAAYNTETSSYNIAWTSEGAPSWFSFQLFMKLAPGYIEAGSQFTITATVTVDAETKITLNGEELTLTAGTNTIENHLLSNTVADSSAAAADLSIQTGWASDSSFTSSGNLQISYLAFDAYTA